MRRETESIEIMQKPFSGGFICEKSCIKKLVCKIIQVQENNWSYGAYWTLLKSTRWVARLDCLPEAVVCKKTLWELYKDIKIAAWIWAEFQNEKDSHDAEFLTE